MSLRSTWNLMDDFIFCFWANLLAVIKKTQKKNSSPSTAAGPVPMETLIEAKLVNLEASVSEWRSAARSTWAQKQRGTLTSVSPGPEPGPELWNIYLIVCVC